LAVFPILPTGLLDSNNSRVERWQTPTSGGEANAIELKAKAKEDVRGEKRGAEGVWITLTDSETEGGGVYILEWNGEGTGGINIVAQWSSEGGESIDGASHAIWLD
jgi:carboxy-cis,cis-muconate cyclase